LEGNEAASDQSDTVEQPPMSWQLVFEEQRKQIIELWHLCHVSLIHRTQFYLLFRGEASDQIYMEVELRRLTWLEQHLADLGNASPALLGDDPATFVSSRYNEAFQRQNLVSDLQSYAINLSLLLCIYLIVNITCSNTTASGP
jgi:hypothetical protein